VTRPVIVVATPHRRYDALEESLRGALAGYEVVRVREKSELTAQGLAPLAPEFVFLPHWSWMIPAEVYSKFECVVFHMTDLPFGRGGSPLQNLIARGHRETMLSALRCTEAVDAGPVYLKRPLSLSGTAEEILTRAGDLMSGMIVEIVTAKPSPVPQKGAVTEFKRRRPSDGDLGQLDELQQVYDFIRMLDADGYPKAFLETRGFHLEFAGAQLKGDAVEARVRFLRRDSK
jgi:methionyl-tRNA formyltransferase